MRGDPMMLSSRHPCSSLLRLVFLLLLSLSWMCACVELRIDQVQHRTTTLCNSTIQGRYLRSDDRGYVCKIMDILPRTGCCPDTTEQYTCRGCNMGSQCCNGYEYCVACCLDPMRTPSEIALKTKVANQVTAGKSSRRGGTTGEGCSCIGTSTTIFDYCRGRCRHNSGSVVHENAYASDNHHCFAPQDNPADEGPEKDDAEFENLTIIIGRQGQSCDAACKGRGKICKLNALPELNKCTKLRKYLNCKEACIGSTGQEQPSEVVSTAPRHMHPGACMYSTAKASFSCQGFHPYSRRLCPCE